MHVGGLGHRDLERLLERDARDLDRPRRGAIQVSHQSLLDLQNSVGAAGKDGR